MSFPITNNLLTPSTKATDLGISPQTTIKTTWNNFEILEDGFSGMKHLERGSYTILESPPKNKWGAMVKAQVNIILSKTKVCLG
jgi:hypothetical protein